MKIKLVENFHFVNFEFIDYDVNFDFNLAVSARVYG